MDGALAALAAAGPGFELPDPGRLYWRARVLERLAERGEAVERAARPLRWVHLAAALLAALLGALALARLSDDLPGTLDSLVRAPAASPAVATWPGCSTWPCGPASPSSPAPASSPPTRWSRSGDPLT